MRRKKRQIKLPIVIIFILLIFLTLYAISSDFLPFMLTLVLFIATPIAIPFIIIKIVRYYRRRAITSDIDKYLRKALRDMDSTFKWYNNEEEANRELVTCLKSQGIKDVYYQPRIGNGRYADAKVGNMLIEGKLSPETKDIDRLLGQLSEYTHHGKVNIVIYGKLHDHAKKRIASEIHNRYPNRAFLTYLVNPKRLRRNHH